MSITIKCDGCQKEIKAPDAAAGKRGKCPYCGHSCYIPVPVSEDDLLPLAPDDEEEERKREQELRAQARELLAEMGGTSGPSVDEKEPHHVPAEELYHFVVNYCMDMASGKLERAETHVARLKRHGYTGLQAVEDFLTGRAEEEAMKIIPKPVLTAYLNQLTQKLR